MGPKSPEVLETQVFTTQDDSPEKQSRKDSLPWLRKPKDTQCSLETAFKHGWKPMTMGAPVLFSFAFASFILAVIIEILAQQSQIKGGLALSASTAEIPNFAKFCYLFLPTIVAVIYSLLWSWIDLDVKRLQPWLEMSRPAGATAANSIFLDYPYEFVALVPFKAARRRQVARHWATFYGSTIMLIIFWLLTPLQSAILGTGPVDVRRTTQVLSSVAPRSAAEQALVMDTAILNEGYAQTWLNQPLPPFTTSEYSLLPFEASSRNTAGSSTNWTGTTTKYWTELECWPAQQSMNGPPSKQSYDFVNGRGCNVSEIVVYGNNDNSLPYRMLYLGYYNSPWADYWLSLTCSRESAANQFLATWGHSDKLPNYKINLTSIFCETNYYKQPVNATVSATDLVPVEDSVVVLGLRERLAEAEFNITAFEVLLGSGHSDTGLDAPKEQPFDHLLEQHTMVEHLKPMWPMSPMSGFAIGSQKNVTTLEIFRNETLLGEAYNSTHKMLFNLAFRRILDNVTVASTSEGHVDLALYGIIVSRLFSAIAEAFLGLVGLFTILLWWHGHRATSRLTMDPASLGSLISLCQNSPALLVRFAGKGALSEEMLTETFKDQRFKLFCGCQSQSRQMVIKIVDIRNNTGEERRLSVTQPDSAFPIGHYSPVKPWALRREVGAAVIVAMMGGVASLIYLKVLEQQNTGIIRPNASFEVLQLLENYVPTIIATLLEPFWVLVNRLLCLLQPFRDLWSGRRPEKGSISARYTSLPPQFVFWRAARSGHFILTAMCGLALLSNLLAVGLGGLFNEESISLEVPQEFQQTLMPRLNNESIIKFANPISRNEVHFYITMNNISQGTPLTPWVSHDQFFQPFTFSADNTARTETYTAQTRGFSTNPTCSDFGIYRTRGKGPALNYTVTKDGAVVEGCSRNSFSTDDLDLNTTSYEGFTGPATAELGGPMSPGDFSLCGVPLMLGWSRSSQVSDRDGEMETSALVCEPTFTTAMFDVTVDSDGYVISSSQVSDSLPTLDYPLSTNHTDTIAAILNYFLIAYARHEWHNNSVSLDWMNYLLKIQPGHADLHDPTSPTPNTTALLPDVEKLYRQLYVLILGNTQQNLWDTYPEPLTITGVRHTTETRIFMNTTALIISLAVLGINIAVAIALYGLAIKHFLPRMPTTIGSILAYLAPSRAVREYDGPGSLSNATFSFGRYVGEDGRGHVGIELDPFVVPVKLSALKKGDTEPRNGLLRRVLGRRKAGRGDDTWL